MLKVLAHLTTFGGPWGAQDAPPVQHPGTSGYGLPNMQSGYCYDVPCPLLKHFQQHTTVPPKRRMRKAQKQFQKMQPGKAASGTGERERER